MSYDDISKALNILSRDVWNTAEKHGFHKTHQVTDRPWIQFVIEFLLIITEIGEAVEALRINDQANFKEELADIIIRALDLAYGAGIEIGPAVIEKAMLNVERPKLHGKKF